MVDSASFTLIRGSARTAYADFEKHAFELKRRIDRGSVFRLDSGSTEDIIAAIIGLDGHCKRIELVPEGVTPPASNGGSPAFRGPTEWVIYTSGTTGAPKAVVHTLQSLSRAVRPSDGSRVWGLVYDPHRLAGLAVLLQAMASGSTLVEARTGSIAERVVSMKSAGVTALSATPTLWRQFLQSGAVRGWPLERITLGGEVSDQRVLDALASAFPSAHVTHIYAASETGVAFSVGDGKEGFPVTYLSSPPRGVRLEIRDDILWVFSPESSLAGPDGFVRTDDVVEVKGDRVVFAGRKTGMVNVGGVKVYPEQVEGVLRTHPSVSEAVVFPKSNPFSGNILLARVTLVSPLEGAATEIRRWAQSRLPPPMVPAQVVVVDELSSSATGKAVRA